MDEARICFHQNTGASSHQFVDGIIRANDIMQRLLLILMSVKFTEKHSIGEALQ